MHAAAHVYQMDGTAITIWLAWVLLYYLCLLACEWLSALVWLAGGRGLGLLPLPGSRVPPALAGSLALHSLPGWLAAGWPLRR